MTTRQIARAALPSVVKITVKDASGTVLGSGSGFVVARDLIATNYHVIENAVAVTANYRDGSSKLVFGLEAWDRSLDIALLYSKTGNTRTLSLGDSGKVVEGDVAITVGAPVGLSGSVSSGIVSGLRLLSGVKLIQMTAPISPGSSGGPVLDQMGRVIGLATAGLDIGQNLNFAVPAGYIKGMIPKDRSRYTPWSAFAKLNGGTPKAEDMAAVTPESDEALALPDIELPRTNFFPLSSIRRLYVCVETLPKFASAIGLTESKVREAVKQSFEKLGKGISVTEDKEAPWLYIALVGTDEFNGSGDLIGYCGALSTSVRQFGYCDGPNDGDERTLTWAVYAEYLDEFSTGSNADQTVLDIVGLIQLHAQLISEKAAEDRDKARKETLDNP